MIKLIANTPAWAQNLTPDDWKLVAFAVEVLEDKLQFGNDIDDWCDSEYDRNMDRLSNMVRAIWAEEH
jgi:hypothetical protein